MYCWEDLVMSSGHEGTSPPQESFVKYCLLVFPARALTDLINLYQTPAWCCLCFFGLEISWDTAQEQTPFSTNTISTVSNTFW